MAKVLYSRKEMFKLNIQTLKKRGINCDDIAKISYEQQSKYIKDVLYKDCFDSVIKILSLRDVFHNIQLGAEIDRLVEEKAFKGPIQDIMATDLGLFGLDELFGLDIAGMYGVIGQTNFGDVDVNKPGIVGRLNDHGKNDGACHTFMDDIVGAIAAAASTRVAQMMNEEKAQEDPHTHRISIYDIE